MTDARWEREARRLLDRALYLAKDQQDDSFARDLRKALGYVAPDDLLSDQSLNEPRQAVGLDERQLDILQKRLEPILETVRQLQRFVLAHRGQDEGQLLALLQAAHGELQSLLSDLQ